MFSALASVSTRNIAARLSSAALRKTAPVNSYAAFAQKLRAFSDEAGTIKGTVKWFDTKKGFGFLIPDDGTEDVFVHQTSVHAEGFRSLAEGEPVEFEVIEEQDGRRKAQGVTGPDGAYVQGAPRRNSFDGYEREDDDFKF